VPWPKLIVQPEAPIAMALVVASPIATVPSTLPVPWPRPPRIWTGPPLDAPNPLVTSPPLPPVIVTVPPIAGPFVDAAPVPPWPPVTTE
jgi:hypothetical protein